jgi:hypothetical protein
MCGAAGGVSKFGMQMPRPGLLPGFFRLREQYDQAARLFVWRCLIWFRSWFLRVLLVPLGCSPASLAWPAALVPGAVVPGVMGLCAGWGCDSIPHSVGQHC